MNTPDYRALCAELLQPLAEYDGANPYHEHRALITRARAALAQPEPGEVGELIAWLHDHALNCRVVGRNDWAAQVTRAAVAAEARTLSPAHAILAAFRERYAETLRPGPFVDRWQEQCLAAALSAAADQVVPKGGVSLSTARVRAQLLAIAAELEGADG